MRTLMIVLGLAAAAATAAQAANAKAGMADYNSHCKSCHGADGTPNAAVAKMMKVEIQDLKSPAVQGMSDADLKKVITDGKGKMKPVASVSGGAADDVVAYIRSLKK
jgi:mono/diheme cytochrome c family protein